MQSVFGKPAVQKERYLNSQRLYEVALHRGVCGRTDPVKRTNQVVHLTNSPTLLNKAASCVSCRDKNDQKIKKKGVSLLSM